MILSSIIKGFFNSIWGALRTWRLDRERVHAARLEAERVEVAEKDKALKKKRKVDAKKYNNIDDVLDDL